MTDKKRRAKSNPHPRGRDQRDPRAEGGSGPSQGRRIPAPFLQVQRGVDARAAEPCESDPPLGHVMIE